MKELIFLTIIGVLIGVVIICIAESCHASDFSVDLQVREIMTTNKDVENGEGVKASLGYSPSGTYRALAWGSYDERALRGDGEKSPWNLNLLGFGVGLEVPVIKYLSLRGDLGYFWSLGKNSFIANQEGEANWWARYLSQSSPNYSVCMHDFAAYTKRIEGGIGGEITANFAYPITERISVGINLGWRIMELPVYREAKIGSGPYAGSLFESRTRENFGGPTTGAAFQLKF